MDRKYELLEDNYINYCGKALYRIKALRDFGYIKKGELGGYIQSENNLSHEGECWVYGNACIYDNARVYGNAFIYDNARVYGNAKICGNAKVYGNAKICGNACIYGHAKVYEGACIYENAKMHGYAEAYGDSCICGNANIHGEAQIYRNAKVSGNININKGHIVGKVSMPYKDIFQYQCENRVLTAILTEDNKILYSIGCQENLTKEKFIYRIHSTFGGLKENPHRSEYLRLIKTINFHFKEKLNN